MGLFSRATTAVLSVLVISLALSDRPAAQQNDSSKPTITFQYLRATVERLSVQQDGTIAIRVSLTNESTSGAGLAVAFKARYSDGIADFWKFFPESEASLTDDVGSNYSLASITGLGFARDENDWAVLSAGNTIGVTAIFNRNSALTSGTRFDFSLPLRLAYFAAPSDLQATAFEAYFSSIAAAGLR